MYIHVSVCVCVRVVMPGMGYNSVVHSLISDNLLTGPVSKKHCQLAAQVKQTRLLCSMCGFPSCTCRLCAWHKQHKHPTKTKSRHGHSCHLRGQKKVHTMTADAIEACT